MSINHITPLLGIYYKETKTHIHGTSLVAQWSRLHLPVQNLWVPSREEELRPHMPHGQNTETQKQYCNRFNKDFKKKKKRNTEEGKKPSYPEKRNLLMGGNGERPPQKGNNHPPVGVR